MRKDNPLSVELGGAGLIACSTLRGKKPKNEDYHRIGRIGNWKVLIIADGVTNSLLGGDASSIAVNTFYDEIERVHNDLGVLSIQLLRQAYDIAAKRLSEVALEKLGKTEGLETTIITIVEMEHSFLISYLGDGRIYLVRGDLEQGIQLMATHRVGSVLGGALGAYGLVGEPVCIEHSKSFQSGEVIIAGSDGAFEQEGNAGSPMIIQVLERLTRNVPSDDDALNELIGALLNDWSNQGFLSDDATLGILVTAKANKVLASRVYDNSKG